ncbi:S-adenosyl-L-methionine-dependent methyltransferase [Gongronella butleri]|nr:S-adenosyl-L-methionine-dependent methyltransferase [Gongronella butleri]
MSSSVKRPRSESPVTATAPAAKKADSTPRRRMLSSAAVVKASPSLYRSFFHKDPVDWTHDARLAIELEYPAKDCREAFVLVCPSQESQEYSPVNELRDTFDLIYSEFLTAEQKKALGDTQHGIMRKLIKHRNRRELEEYVDAIEQWNNHLRTWKELLPDTKSALPLSTGRRHPSYALASHILDQIYSRTAAWHVDKLNQYKAFSNYVYGEINASFINKEIIQRTGLRSKSVFVDLGSGIGNVVLQVAAQTGCEAFGIEAIETRVKLAKRMLKEYGLRMKAWGLPTGKVHFRQGDFLDGSQKDLVAMMRRADVVVVNNYAFDSATNHGLLQLFLDLKEGAQIVSLKSFVNKNHTINARTFHLPESILQVQELPYYSDAVSWSNQDGVFYLSTVNRTRLARYT